MNEEAKALHDIKFWIAVFVIWFVIFVGVFIGMGVSFIEEVQAYNSCSHVEDDKFTACYTAAKE